MHYKRYCLFGLLIILLLSSSLSCQRKKQTDIDQKAIEKALSWVQQYPASFDDGRFVEISEEIITFYLQKKYTDDQREKEHYLEEIKRRIETIAANKEFSVQPLEYTMYLCIAAISEKCGLNSSMDFKKTIENQIIPNPQLYPPHITTCIWNTVYLERLGFKPPKTLEEFLPLSTLATESNQKLLYEYTQAKFDQMYVDPMSITIYDITHEIFSLTDFGEIPPPPIFSENQVFFSELFDRSIKWAIVAEHVDVLAEIIMCVKLLHLEDVPSMDRGINYILSRQEEDGSFGVTNPGRKNIRRHGVLVSIMALAID